MRRAVFLSIIGLIPTCYRPVLRAMYTNPYWGDLRAVYNMQRLYEIARAS